MSETVQIVTMILAFLGTVFTGLVALATLWLNLKADKAAKEVKEVKEVLGTSTAKTDNKLSEVHELVNSAMLSFKKRHWEKCESAVADNPTAKNIAEAKAAKAEYDDHLATQEKMDIDSKQEVKKQRSSQDLHSKVDAVKADTDEIKAAVAPKTNER